VEPASGSSDDFCYRHPKRESFVLCQRCGRTICGDCQIPAPVGVHCPECRKNEQVASGGSSGVARRLLGRTQAAGGFSPVVTYVLLGVMGVVYALQWLTGGFVTQLLLYWPPITAIEPWRMVTTIFVHSTSSIFHILFNGYSLYILGTLVERLVGRGRFLWLFLLSGLGGSVAVLWLSPSAAVVGASGAIFGLFGALFVIQRSFGGANTQLLIVLGLNLVLGFVVPGISWQAHIGGLLVGALVAWIFVRTRGNSTRLQERTQLIGIVVGLGAVTVAGALL
jgi:membrane associated rhomboid family serine protease